MGAIDASLEELMRTVVREEIAAALDKLAGFRAPPAPPRLESLLSIEDVVKVIGRKVKPETVQAWCRSGRLVARKAGHRWVIRREDLEAFMVEHRGAAPAVSPKAAAEQLERKVRAGGQR